MRKVFLVILLDLLMEGIREDVLPVVFGMRALSERWAGLCQSSEFGQLW